MQTNSNCPCVSGVARAIAAKRFPNDPILAHQWFERFVHETCQLAAPVLHKFDSMFILPDGKLFDTMQLYHALQLVDSLKILLFAANEINQRINYLLDHVPFIRAANINMNGSIREGLRTELAIYIELARTYIENGATLTIDQLVAGNIAALNDAEDGIPPVANLSNEPLISWWKGNNRRIPTWTRWILQLAVLIVPSSAGAERVFSIIRWMFGDDQDAGLEDLKEGSLLLRYNNTWRGK